MNTLEKIALTKIKGVGPRISRLLLAYCGSVGAIFQSDRKQLMRIPGIGLQTVEAILSRSCLSEAEKELEFVHKHNIEMMWLEDPCYPKRLRHCDDAPLLLYFKGKGELNPRRTVSIVGSRNATTYGKRICEQLVQGLKNYDVQIISGLAYGIDVISHREALKHHISTIAVLGHGLDRIYPSSHREVASSMLAMGGLLTEFPSGTNPDRSNFPMRNRIIAGLADVTIVVEAAFKGGALITAEIANTYNRDVCAFPGSIDQEYSAGCNYLIKTHRAHLIRHADDLGYLMNWSLMDETPKDRQLPLIPEDLSKDELKVYHFLKDQEQSTIDGIATYCDWPQSKLAIILLEMEMKGRLLSLPGKIFKLI